MFTITGTNADANFCFRKAAYLCLSYPNMKSILFNVQDGFEQFYPLQVFFINLMGSPEKSCQIVFNLSRISFTHIL
jgi:hypothetical protein